MSVIPNDGNSTPDGDANANSQPSQSESQPLPEYVKTIRSRLDAQDKLIKGTQKGADKQIGQVRDDLKRILELKEQGLDEAEIKRELWIDSQMQGTNPPAEPVPAGSGTSKVNLDFQTVDTALELPLNDSRVTDLKLKFGSDPTAYLREALKLKSTLQTTPPSPAEQLPPAGGGLPSAKGADELIDEYKTTMRAARGKPAELRLIKDKYIKLGVKVHEVDFT